MKVEKKKICSDLKKRIWRCAFFLGSMMLLAIGYYAAKKCIRVNYSIAEDNFSWVYQVDDIAENDGKICFRGWAFQLDKDAKKNKFDIILRDISSGKSFFADMKYETRVDVNEFFLCQYDYTESGFVAMIDKEKLDIENGVYEFLLQPKTQRTAYETNIYYAQNEISFTNPLEFIPLDTDGTDMEVVTRDGVLRGYLSDKGIYIYQYDGCIYWIMDETYAFNAAGNAYLQYQIATTQPWKLPEQRLMEGKETGYMSFQFKEKELANFNTGKYRVAKAELPQKYSITSIRTGVTTETWLWKYDFRPWYKFD